MNPLLSSLWIVAVASPAADGVVGWRGDGTGRYPEAQPPGAWDIDAGQNILWQTNVGKAQSTPVIAGGKIVLTAEPDKLLAVDRDTGKLLWTRANGYESLPADIKAPAKPPSTAPGCGYASPSPVTDGRFVYASFGTGIVVGYDLSGNRRWIRHLDVPLLTEYGRSGSPVLAAGKLLISFGGVVALDPQSGATAWENREAKPTYGTPAVTRIGDVVVAITPNGDCLRVADGRRLASGLGQALYTSPIVHGDVVYLAGPPVVAVACGRRTQAGADEKPSPEEIPFTRLWDNDDFSGDWFASPVYHEGLLYAVSNSGTFVAFDAATGKVVFERELDIRNASGKPGIAPGNMYPSLTLIGTRLLLSNDMGESLVLAPGREYREVSRNFLDRGSGATPVPDGNRLFLRGADVLYCIGARSPK